MSAVRGERRALLRLGVLLGALLVVLAGASLLVGPAPLQWLQVLGGLLDTDAGLAALVVNEIRLPRTLLALLVGASLGLSGAALQGLLRNPLAEPAIIGVSGTAALGAVLVFYSGLAGDFRLAVPLAGMGGALLAVTALAALAGRDSSVLTLVLAGVAINSMSAALTSLALNLSPNPFAAYEVMTWLMGSLADRSMQHVQIIVLPVVMGAWLLLGSARGLDALSIGEDGARSLGVELQRLQWRVVAGTALCVGAAVSVTGVVGFVGLIVPHVLRPLVGHRPGALLPVSALGGALLLLAADIVVRLVGGQVELRLGVLTALLGSPFFLYLVLATRRQMR